MGAKVFYISRNAEERKARRASESILAAVRAWETFSLNSKLVSYVVMYHNEKVDISIIR